MRMVSLAEAFVQRFPATGNHTLLLGFTRTAIRRPCTGES
jgi:hypothetical protein